MEARAFYTIVTGDRVNLEDRILSLLEREGIHFCVIGGQAVNAYVEPLVSLDLDIATDAGDLARLENALRKEFAVVERFPHSLNVNEPGSDLRVQFQTDPRYSGFVARSRPRAVLGRELPVAAVEDVFRGKVWAASDPGRRPSKRQKDLADIARLVEAMPALRDLAPSEILDRLEKS